MSSHTRPLAVEHAGKGDLTVQDLVWYVWRNGGYMPLE
jgi:hypothetical protein